MLQKCCKYAANILQTAFFNFLVFQLHSLTPKLQLLSYFHPIPSSISKKMKAAAIFAIMLQICRKLIFSIFFVFYILWHPKYTCLAIFIQFKAVFLKKWMQLQFLRLCSKYAANVLQTHFFQYFLYFTFLDTQNTHADLFSSNSKQYFWKKGCCCNFCDFAAKMLQKCCKNAAKFFFFNEHPFWLFLSCKKLPIPKFSCFAQKNNPRNTKGLDYCEIVVK